jgi:hypothetical protein
MRLASIIIEITSYVVPKEQAERAGPRRGKGLRMTPVGPKPGAVRVWLATAVPRRGQAQSKNDVDRRRLRIRRVAERPAKKALHHYRGGAFQKVLLAADVKPHRIDVNNSRPVA